MCCSFLRVSVAILGIFVFPGLTWCTVRSYCNKLFLIVKWVQDQEVFQPRVQLLHVLCSANMAVAQRRWLIAGKENTVFTESTFLVVTDLQSNTIFVSQVQSSSCVKCKSCMYIMCKRVCITLSDCVNHGCALGFYSGDVLGMLGDYHYGYNRGGRNTSMDHGYWYNYRIQGHSSDQSPGLS